MRRLLPYLPFLLITLIMAPVAWPARPDVGDDYVMWSAGHIVVTGGSPYDIAAWQPAQAGTPGVWNVMTNIRPADLDTMWLYPPWTAVMWAPFGALPPELGVPLIHLFLVACAIAAVLLLVRALGIRERWTIALMLAIGASFMPLVLASHVGHFSAVLLLGVLLVARGLERGGPSPALAAGAILLSLKPHLFIGFAIVVAIGVLGRRRRILRPAAAAAAAVASIAAASFVRYPLSIEQLVRAAGEKASFDVATTAQLLGALGADRDVVFVTVGVVAFVVCAALAYLVPRMDPRLGEWPLVAGGLLLSLIVVPFSHDWDQALVLPALVVSVAATAAVRRAVRIGVLVAVFVVASYAMVAFFAGHVIASQAPSAATPLLAVALLLGSLTIAVPRRVSISVLAVAPAAAPASVQHVPALERGG